MAIYVGIDIGGTKIAGGLVDESGAVLRRAERPTPAREGGRRVLQEALDLARSIVDADRITGVGVGAGGQVDSDRGVIASATEILPGWAGIAVKDSFEAELRVPTAVDNDVNALALGQIRFGAAKGLPTVVFLSLGTGVGGALLINGRIHHGAHWVGGEMGHILLSIEPGARRDASGHAGCLEAYCSGSGLVQTWRELTGSMEESISGREIAAEAAADPSGPAARAVRMTGEYLGYGLVTLANALDPGMVVIGGGLAALGEALLAPARAVLAARALPGPASCPVLPASLGADAALIGAASLAMP